MDYTNTTPMQDYTVTTGSNINWGPSVTYPATYPYYVWPAQPQYYYLYQQPAVITREELKTLIKEVLKELLDSEKK